MVQKKTYFLLLTGCLMILVTACSTPQGNSDDGKRWYMMHNCYSCHGLNGDDGQGPVVDTKKLSFRRFNSIVRDAKSPIMPEFPKEKLSDQDIVDIYTWLDSK